MTNREALQTVGALIHNTGREHDGKPGTEMPSLWRDGSQVRVRRRLLWQGLLALPGSRRERQRLTEAGRSPDCLPAVPDPSDRLRASAAGRRMSTTDSGRAAGEGEVPAARPVQRRSACEPCHVGHRRCEHSVDDVVVDRLVSGQPLDEFTSRERREAVRRLRVARLTYKQIAARLGIHERQVHRYLCQVGLVEGRAVA